MNLASEAPRARLGTLLHTNTRVEQKRLVRHTRRINFILSAFELPHLVARYVKPESAAQAEGTRRSPRVRSRVRTGAPRR
jgi:hypothetical protein